MLGSLAAKESSPVQPTNSADWDVDTGEDEVTEEDSEDPESGSNRRGNGHGATRRRSRRPPWSREEEAVLCRLHAQWGCSWSRIAKELPGRTSSEVKVSIAGEPLHIRVARAVLEASGHLGGFMLFWGHRDSRGTWPPCFVYIMTHTMHICPSGDICRRFCQRVERATAKSLVRREVAAVTCLQARHSFFRAGYMMPSGSRPGLESSLTLANSAVAHSF